MRSTLFSQKSTLVIAWGFGGTIAVVLAATTMLSNTGAKTPKEVVFSLLAGGAIASGIAGAIVEKTEQSGKSSVFSVQNPVTLEPEEFRGYQVQVPQLEHPYLEQDARSYQELVRAAASFPLQPLSPQQVQALAQSPEIAQQLQDLIDRRGDRPCINQPYSPAK